MNWLAGNSDAVFVATAGDDHPFRFVCDLRDGIAREVYFTRRYEPQETEVVRRSLGPGMTFLDVGANWGYFTLLAASIVGSLGKVIALEPDPRVFGRLSENVQLNSFGQVLLRPFAAADRAGTVRFRGYDDSQSNWGTSRIETAAARPEDMSVEARTLDGLLSEASVGVIDLLKMDIQGAEGFALRGLTETLKARGIRRAIIELHPEAIRSHGQTVEMVTETLRSNGYRGWSINHSPATTRRAAYARRIRVEDYLRPFHESASLDDWPHTLWVRDDLEILPGDRGR